MVNVAKKSAVVSHEPEPLAWGCLVLSPRHTAEAGGEVRWMKNENK